MKLYYSAGSCSTSCHITLEESGLKYEAIEVDFDNPSDPNLVEAMRLNPLGTLPVAITDEGKHLTQNISIHMYVAEKAKGKNLMPAYGSMEWNEAMNWLSFVASDLHKGFTPIFAASGMSKIEQGQKEIRDFAVHNLENYFSYLDKNLAGKDYLLGKNFSVADAYCFVVMSWAKYLKVSTQKFPTLEAYLGRVYQRPAVQKVMKEEGLLE